jgi:hypothetical protein
LPSRSKNQFSLVLFSASLPPSHHYAKLIRGSQMPSGLGNVVGGIVRFDLRESLRESADFWTTHSMFIRWVEPFSAIVGQVVAPYLGVFGRVVRSRSTNVLVLPGSAALSQFFLVFLIFESDIANFAHLLFPDVRCILKSA